MKIWLLALIAVVAPSLVGASTPPPTGEKPITPAPLPKNGYESVQLSPYLEAKEWIILSLDPMPWKVKMGDDPFAVPPEAPPPTGGKPAVDPFDGKPIVPPKEKEKIVVPPEKDFHDYEILGQVKVPMSPKLEGVIMALDRAGQTSSGLVAGCFNPRHGIRVVVGGETYDLLICYQCMAAILYREGKDVGYIRLAGPNAPSPAVLNTILAKARVRLIPANH